MLKNGDFEKDWAGDHLCHVFPADEKVEIGNIFVPPDWTFWFRHEPGTWDQPEGRDARKSQDPVRVLEGEKAYMYFTFFRRHDAGLYQKVQVEPGALVKFGAHAHAWSNHSLPNHEDCANDPRCSCGVGKDVVMLLEHEIPALNGDPWNDSTGNFKFLVGIDPTGGTDPFSDTVVWGKPVTIYNGYCAIPQVETVAQAGEITVFLRSTTLWKFQHNDAYWDAACLEIHATEHRGAPRVQYDRTYVLMPPDANTSLARAALGATWTGYRFTVGGSADDAGIGDLEHRCVIAVNPDAWTSDLGEFYAKYYKGVVYLPLPGCTPENVAQKLCDLLNPTPPTNPLLLWQCDPTWKDKRYAGGRCSTFCAQGCWIACCAMAQRYYGIAPDATPETVDALLGSSGYTPNCLMLWGAMEKYLGIKVTSHTTSLANVNAHLDAGNICFAEVEPLSLMHFVMVTRHEGTRYWMLDPWRNIEGWLDEYYTGVDSWRLVTKMPEAVRRTFGHVGLHLQAMVPGVEEFTRELKPAVMKALVSMQDVIGLKRWSPDTAVVYRHVDNNQGPYLEDPDALRGARKWVDTFRDSLYEVCNQLHHLEPPYFYVESLNETYPSLNTSAVKRAADFDEAFCHALAETNLPIAPVVYCAAVGNPHQTEYPLLVDMARACEAYGGLMGYHNYWFANPNVSGLTSWWEWHAGRWAYIDQYLVTRGIHVKWYGGEAGAVGSPDGYSLLPNDGWKSGECYRGDWSRYLSDILECDRRICEWNKTHGDRYLGFVLFTTGAGFTGWKSFQIQEAQMRDIKQELMA